MDRTVLHCDMNSFYASVELLEHPELKDVPVAVSGSPEKRHGIILAKNELAKKSGVVTAETVQKAQKKCPGLVLLPPHHKKYLKYSKLINRIYARYTDMIEPFSIDESWLDVTGSIRLFGSGEKIADDIRKAVKSELGLTLSAGVAWNKVMAKMGSEYKKPDATTVVTRENFKDLFWNKPVGELFFAGNAASTKLRSSGILTIGDLASSDRGHIFSLLGKNGLVIHDYANGIDDAPVAPMNERSKIKSVGNGVTFRRDLISQDDIHTAVTGLCDRVSARLRKHELKAGGVRIEIKDPAFKTISRQMQMDVSANTSEELAARVLAMINASWKAGNPIRLMTVTGINLTGDNEAEQLGMFAPEESAKEKSESLGKTMDAIRSRYGDSAISYGRMIGNDIGIELDDYDEDFPD